MQCPTNCDQTWVSMEIRIHCSIVRLWTSWRLMRMKNCLRSGKQRTMSKGGLWIHVKSKLPVRRKYSICWDIEVYEYSTEAEARARTGRNPVALSGSIPTRKVPMHHVTVPVWCVRGSPKRCRTDLLGNTSAGNSANPTRCCVSGRLFFKLRTFS